MADLLSVIKTEHDNEIHLYQDETLGKGLVLQIMAIDPTMGPLFRLYLDPQALTELSGALLGHQLTNSFTEIRLGLEKTIQELEERLEQDD